MAKNDIKIGGNTKGKVRIGNMKDVKNSELTESENNIDLQGDFEGELEVDNKEGLDGVKSKKTIVWIIAAIGAVILGVASYYFTREEPQLEPIKETQIIKNDSIA